MPDGPPRPRITVVEKDGRLTVIDTATGKPPPSAAERQGGLSPPPMPHRNLLGDTRGSLSGAPRDLSAGTGKRTMTPATGTRDMAHAAVSDDPMLRLLHAVAGRKRDGSGRLLVNTRRWFDARGPRTAVLSAAGERRAATILLVALMLPAAMIVLSIILSPLVLLIPAVMLIRSGKQIAHYGARMFETP